MLRCNFDKKYRGAWCVTLYVRLCIGIYAGLDGRNCFLSSIFTIFAILDDKNLILPSSFAFFAEMGNRGRNMYRFSVEVGRKVSPGLPREAIDTTFLLSKNAKMDGRNPVLAFKTQKTQNGLQEMTSIIQNSRICGICGVGGICYGVFCD